MFPWSLSLSGHCVLGIRRHCLCPNMCQGVIEACRLIAWALGVLGLNGETSQTLISLVGVGGLGADFETNEIGRDFLPPFFADGRWQSGASPSRLWRTGAAPRRDKGGRSGVFIAVLSPLHLGLGARPPPPRRRCRRREQRTFQRHGCRRARR